MWIILFLVLFVARPTHVSAAVVINELFPKSADLSHTWIELYNTDNESVSLDRWKLENTSNNGRYVLNAAAVIAPHGFLTFFQPQTGITMSIDGDTVRLLDDKNTLMDSQGYPGILGYNTAMGRSTDGSAGWVICSPPPEYAATPNAVNKCPPPATAIATVSPTVIASHAPTAPPTPVPLFVPSTPTTTIDSTSLFAFPDVLGDAATPTPASAPTHALNDILESDAYKKVWLFALIFGVGLGLIIMGIGLYYTRRKS